MEINSLDNLIQEGSKLFKGSDAVETHSRFERWIDHVLDWLNKSYPNTGLSGLWLSLGHSLLVTSQGYSNDDNTWAHFQGVVQQRMNWLGNIGVEAAKIRNSTPVTTQEQASSSGRKEIKLELTSSAYIDPSRIENLLALKSTEFDLSKLIRLCEELNLAFATESYLSMPMLTRAIMDHIPPIFGFKTFKELANSYGDGGKSFKDQMQHLENSSRKIADGYLHTPIRQSESLPTVTQVNFSNIIDSLLAEIVRVLKVPSK
ncbi:MAG: hypothetical protein R2800_09505 [Flavipsychrobacter sp.]